MPTQVSQVSVWRHSCSNSSISTHSLHFIAAGSASYALGWPSMTRDLHASNFKATIGISMWTMGFAIVPLVISSLSEEFGRQPIYLVSVIGFCLVHLIIAKCAFYTTPVPPVRLTCVQGTDDTSRTRRSLPGRHIWPRLHFGGSLIRYLS